MEDARWFKKGQTPATVVLMVISLLASGWVGSQAQTWLWSGIAAIGTAAMSAFVAGIVASGYDDWPDYEGQDRLMKVGCSTAFVVGFLGALGGSMLLSQRPI